MKKMISALLIPVICLCLMACGSLDSNANIQDNTTTEDTAVQEYVGVWKASTTAFNLDGDTWIETLTITLCEDGTGIFREKNATWKYDDKYGQYGTIELTLSSGGTVSLIIDEKDGKTVLKASADIYYSEKDFAEATQ